MQQPFPRADVRFDLVVGVAEHLLPARRVHDRAGFEVPVPDAFLRAGERQRQPLFALAQRRLGPLALGDVEVRADDAHDRSAGPGGPESRARARGCSGRPCAAAGTRLRRSVRRARTLSFSCWRQRLVVGMQQALPGADVGFDLVLGVAEHLLPSRRVDRRRWSRDSSPRRLPARRRTPASAVLRSRAARPRCAGAR